ncbi:MAG: hypothetical protein WC795_00855 [Candidatus Paceibacterota bacterium]|jgi:hypothetical protein
MREAIPEQKKEIDREEIAHEAENLLRYLTVAGPVIETPEEKSDYKEMYLKFQKLLTEINNRKDSESVLREIGIDLDTQDEIFRDIEKPLI